MPQGLQVFNAAGALILDIGSRPLKILSIDTITASVNATIPITQQNANNTVVPIVINGESLEPPILSISGGNVNVSWQANPGSGTSRLLVAEF